MPRDNTFIETDTAATTGDFTIKSGERNQVRISADALAGAEVVDIQVWQGPEDTGDFFNSGDQLTATEPSKVVLGPGAFRLAKGVTISTCAVFLDT